MLSVSTRERLFGETFHQNIERVEAYFRQLGPLKTAVPVDYISGSTKEIVKGILTYCLSKGRGYGPIPKAELDINGELQATYCNRTIQDIYRFCLSFDNEVSLKEVYQALYELIYDYQVTCIRCPDIQRVVYYVMLGFAEPIETGKMVSNCDYPETTDEWGIDISEFIVEGTSMTKKEDYSEEEEIEEFNGRGLSSPVKIFLMIEEEDS